MAAQVKHAPVRFLAGGGNELRGCFTSKLRVLTSVVTHLDRTAGVGHKPPWRLSGTLSHQRCAFSFGHKREDPERVFSLSQQSLWYQQSLNGALSVAEGFQNRTQLRYSTPNGENALAQAQSIFCHPIPHEICPEVQSEWARNGRDSQNPI